MLHDTRYFPCLNPIPPVRWLARSYIQRNESQRWTLLTVTNARSAKTGVTLMTAHGAIIPDVFLSITFQTILTGNRTRRTVSIPLPVIFASA